MAATTPTLQRYFFGFSTQNSVTTGIRTLYDIQLINVDLMAAFQTRVGERVMRPDWGCKLWNYLMEPFTTVTSNQIIEEVYRICQLDTRLTVMDVQVFQLGNGFRIECMLQYKPWLVIQSFTANFEQNEFTYFDSTPNANALVN